MMADMLKYVVDELNPLHMGHEIVRGAMEALDTSDWMFMAGSAVCLASAYCALRGWANGRASTTGGGGGGNGNGGDHAAKSRSWILSFITAPLFIASGCTSVVGLVTSGYSPNYVTQDSPWHRASLLVFLAFLALDLLIGSIDYASEVRATIPFSVCTHAQCPYICAARCFCVAFSFSSNIELCSCMYFARASACC